MNALTQKSIRALGGNTTYQLRYTNNSEIDG